MDLLRTELFQDTRGRLQVWESLPFEVKRFFHISGVPKDEARGDHANRTCKQIIVCLDGLVHFNVSGYSGRIGGTWDEQFVLLPGQAFLLKPMQYVHMFKFSKHASLLVLCSELYDPNGYIHGYSAWYDEVTQYENPLP